MACANDILVPLLKVCTYLCDPVPIAVADKALLQSMLQGVFMLHCNGCMMQVTYLYATCYDFGCRIMVYVNTCVELWDFVLCPRTAHSIISRCHNIIMILTDLGEAREV